MFPRVYEGYLHYIIYIQYCINGQLSGKMDRCGALETEGGRLVCSNGIAPISSRSTVSRVTSRLMFSSYTVLTAALLASLCARRIHLKAVVYPGPRPISGGNI